MANALKTHFQGVADAIREKTGETGVIKPTEFADKIRGISGGGGSSALVKYVTFMSWDGNTELFKMPVLSGDDCKDPVTHGDISKPTKASTNTQNFEYSGWSLTSGGSANSNVLKKVTEDKIVYASYTASVRYYTVNFYDGNTLVDTVQVTYGGTAITDYIKDGYTLVGWNPSNENITKDTNCYGEWTEGLKFSNASWERIAELSASGEASSVFSVGDERIIDIDGVAVTFMIAGFNHDTLADGSGKAGITIITKNVPQITAKRPDYLWRYRATYVDNLFMKYLPSELSSLIKPVNKKCESSGDPGTDTVDVAFNLFPLSFTELGVVDQTLAVENFNTIGEKYECFGTTSQYKNIYVAPYNTTKANVIVRGNRRNYSTSNTLYILSGSTASSGVSTTSANSVYYYPFGFCI